MEERQGFETELIDGGTFLTGDWVIQASKPFPIEIFSSECFAAPAVFSCDQIPKSFGPHGQILIFQIPYLKASFLIRHLDFILANQVDSMEVPFASFPKEFPNQRLHFF